MRGRSRGVRYGGGAAATGKSGREQKPYRWSTTKLKNNSLRKTRKERRVLHVPTKHGTQNGKSGERQIEFIDLINSAACSDHL